MTTNETEIMYSTIQEAFDFFNQQLFRGELPSPIFTLQRKNKTAGYYSRKRFKEIYGERFVDEIALNPNCFVASGEIDIMQTLVHEMCHMWQFHFGTPSRRSYHNREFAEKMKSVGLMPSATGKVGGNETGQNMSDYPIPGGLFLRVFEAWKLRGKPIRWASLEAFLRNQDPSIVSTLPDEVKVLTDERSQRKSKFKFSCVCGQNAWAKQSAVLICGLCRKEMVRQSN